MRPERLSLQAFGPYVQAQTVDLRTLEGRSLLLICGPVGAGKTTLLDALCYALYGVSSGGERLAEQLRSHLAPADLPTRVELDFSAGAQTWRISRNSQEVALWNITGRPAAGELPLEEAEATGATVEQRVESLLQLGSAQFLQSAVIPQGHFRRFLTAPAEDKELMLERLFGTQPLRQVEAALLTAAEEAQEEMRAAWQRRDQLVRDAEVGQDEDFHQELGETKARLVAIDDELQKLRRHEGELALQAERTVVVRERSQELEAARELLQSLESREHEMEAERRLLDRYQKADELSSFRESFELASLEAQAAQARQSRAQEDLAAGDLAAPEQALVSVRQREQERSQLVAMLSRLDNLAERFHSLRQVSLELDQSIEESHRLQQLYERVSQAIAECSVEIEEREQARNQASQLEVQAVELRTRLEQSRRWQRKHRQFFELDGSLSRLRLYLNRAGARYQELDSKLAGLRKEVSDLEQARLRSQAAALAARLARGEPCPVCGSLEHPHPSGESGLAPSPRELESRRNQLAQTQTLLDKLRKEQNEQELLLARMEERMEILRGELMECEQPAEEMEQATVGLQQELRRVEKLLAARHGAEAEVQRLRERRQRLTEKRRGLEAQLRTAEQKQAKLEGLVKERGGTLGDEYASLDDLLSAKDETQHKIRLLERSLDTETQNFGQRSGEYAQRLAASKAAQQGLENALDRVRQAREAYLARLAAAGFTDPSEAEGSLTALPDPEGSRLALRRFEAELEAARRQVERNERSLRESQEFEAVSELTLDEVQRRRELCLAERARLQLRIGQLERWVEDYHRVVVEIQRLDPRLNVLRKLARTAAGENRSEMSFHRFWVAQVLESVLVPANRRLALMTRSRYRLQRMPGAKEASLELAVRDQQSGTVRSVTTLSGGESFLAALALALGLADASANRRGGPSPLDTLFIDEGFANLDEEALELALQGLAGLQREGRLVGIISHLPELRERIDARLEVVPGPLGSVARLVVGA